MAEQMLHLISVLTPLTLIVRRYIMRMALKLLIALIALLTLIQIE